MGTARILETVSQRSFSAGNSGENNSYIHYFSIGSKTTLLNSLVKKDNKTKLVLNF